VTELNESQLRRIRRFVQPYRITDGGGFQLDAVDPGGTGTLTSEFKDEAKELLEDGVERLAEQQAMFYAHDQWALLLIFQARDAAGKDSTIKHVMSGVNPQGCQVHPFKRPSAEELDHDYLWRCHPHVPARGQIGIFNRSYYEEVLVVRVHDELLQYQKLPPSLVSEQLWEQRYEDINNFERYLARNGVVIMKFFLHVSAEEQKKRFLDRLNEPEKHWKFSAGDIRERGHWEQYSHAYQEMIRNTAAGHAPWYVVPADKKWFTRLVVVAAIVETIAGLEVHYPQVDADRRSELEAARDELLKE